MKDWDDILGGPIAPDPLAPIIPTLEVIREWPYFRDPEDVDRDSLETVVDELRNLWDLTSNLQVTIDNPAFHAPNAIFWYEENGDRCELDHIECNGQLAVANLQFLRDCWHLELSRPALKPLSVIPSPAIIWGLIDDRIDTSGARSILRNSLHHLNAIASLEKCRQRIISEVGPTIEVFLKSLELASDTTAATRKLPTTPRSDEPSAVDIQNGRLVLRQMGVKHPSKTAFRNAFRDAGHSVSNAKAGRILDEIKKQQESSSPPSPGDETD